MVSMGVVRALLEAVEMSGVSALELLRAAKVEPDAVRVADASMTRSQSYRLCELAMDLTRDPALGIHWVERLSAHSFTPISPLIEHAPTLRQAFESLSEFHRLLTDNPGFELMETRDKVTVRCEPLASEPRRIQIFVAEMVVTGVFRLIRSFGVPARKLRVQFAYEAPSHRAEYARVFEGAQHFDGAFTGLVFDRALMDTAALQNNEEVHSALRTVAKRRMVRLMQCMTYSTRVCDMMVERGPAARTDMKIIARQLGISMRSLRRRLSAEGTTYKSLTSDARATMAKRLLLTTQASIKEVAYDLGFADSTAFHRAFKRRTGMTPQGYRTHQATVE